MENLKNYLEQLIEEKWAYDSMSQEWLDDISNDFSSDSYYNIVKWTYDDNWMLNDWISLFEEVWIYEAIDCNSWRLEVNDVKYKPNITNYEDLVDFINTILSSL